jgi:hypothetical protein
VTYGGDSGNRIFVLYWRCPLIRVFVIRGCTVLYFCGVYGLCGMSGFTVHLPCSR